MDEKFKDLKHIMDSRLFKNYAKKLESSDLNHLEMLANNVLYNLNSYQSTEHYILELEKFKGQKGYLSPLKERDGLDHSISAVNNIRLIVTNYLQIIKHMQSTEIYDELIKIPIESIGRFSELSLSNMWKFLINQVEIKNCFSKKGINENYLSLIDDLIKKNDVTYSIKDDNLYFKKHENNWTRLKTEKTKEFTTENIWESDLLETVIDQLKTPRNYNIEIDRVQNDLEPSDKALNINELIVMEPLLALQEAESTMYLLEETGFPAIHGKDPWIIIAILIAAAACIAIGVTIIIVCIASDDLELREDTVCKVGMWLTIIGGILLSGAGACADGNCKVKGCIIINGRDICKGFNIHS